MPPQVTFDHDGKVPYIEGQSIGVIAPGPAQSDGPVATKNQEECFSTG